MNDFIRMKAAGLKKTGEGLVQETGVPVKPAQLIMGSKMKGIEFPGLLQGLLGQLRFLTPEINQAQVVVPHEVLRIFPNGRFKFSG